MTNKTNVADDAFEKWFEQMFTSEGVPLLDEESARRGYQAASQHYEREIESWKQKLGESIAERVFTLDNVKSTAYTILRALEKCNIDIARHEAANIMFERFTDIHTKACHETITELTAQVNQLRDLIERIIDNDGADGSKCFDANRLYIARIKARELLDSTPAQSLAEHDAEVMELAAKVCEDAFFSKESPNNIVAKAFAESIRALKSK